MAAKRTWDKRLESVILRVALAVARHWLMVANATLAVFITLPLLAPLLMARGQTGPANAIYSAYRITCHQEPYRSFFLAGPRATYTEAEIATLTTVRPLAAFVGSPATGYKMAYCERDAATYLFILVSGLVFAVIGKRLPRLPLRVYALFLAPIALDGLTQLVGWRESTWLLRGVTGGLFGMATAWLLYPELNDAMRHAASEMTTRLAHSKE